MEHLDADAAIGALFEKLAHVLDGFNSRVAVRMGVG
jgi:hypothetical protein